MEKVLIVDDSLVQAAQLKSIIVEEYDTTIVHTAAEGLSQACSGEYSLILLDVILRDECCSCKEIYYQAAREDPSIGMATVYRMIKILEDTGLIQRKNMYHIDTDGVIV